MTEKGIVIHCSDTYPEMDIGFKEINQWHLDRGWSGCGYHFIIRRNGKIEKGRPIGQSGAHAKGYNHYIGICLVGGKAHTGQQATNFTSDQWQSLSDLVGKLIVDQGIPPENIIGHNEVSEKNCPTFDVQAWKDLGV